MSDPAALDCFLLNYSSADRNGRFEITLYAAAAEGMPVKIQTDTQRPLFFVQRSTPHNLTAAAQQRAALHLKSFDGQPLDCLYFRTHAACRDAARRFRSGGVPVYESDIHPVDRFLMERFIKGGFSAQGKVERRGKSALMINPRLRGKEVTPNLRVLSLDIETNASTGALYSIAFCGSRESVFIIGAGKNTDSVHFCPGESDLLHQIMEYIAVEDPDIIIGWSVVDFDLWMLQDRCSFAGVPFALGRGDGARVITLEQPHSHRVAKIPGRIVLDVPTMLRASYHTFDEYSLEHVASHMLGKHKIITESDGDKIAEIDRLFAHDKLRLAAYNLQDARLTKEIFDRASILPNLIERTKRSGLPLDRTGGSAAAFDYLYLPFVHRMGYAAIDVADVPPPSSPLPGGYVMESRPGLHENVILLDFRSLYPSIIRTFKIDPVGLAAPSKERVQGPVGPSFARDKSILPSIIAELMAARAEANRKNNTHLSYAIKILMNSFYGVLGSTGCRFFSWDLAHTITATGQYILKETAAFLTEKLGNAIIYGDTDSLFVALGPGRQAEAVATGQSLAAQVTAWLATEIKSRFKANSALELKFETHFRHFFMPTIRGSQQGSKKRYCGAIEENGSLRLVFKGLESARSDWTDFAKEFQNEIYLRVFSGTPVDEYIVTAVRQLRAGKLDDKLIYRKRVRKEVEEYADHVPPHIQAAKLLDAPVHRVAYYITKQGPQPTSKLSAPIDYDHYVECQLKPIADSIIEWVGLRFDTIVSGQQELFT